ncbi:MAG: hypothetical protein KDD94_08120, partial [Calditrichaeota bacterium]|nr:hypothetical protein [Calditrichota bacterium]
MHGNLISSVKDPGPLKLSGNVAKWQKWFMMAPAAILLALLGAIVTDNMKLFWQHYVIETYYFLGFGLFGLIFAAIHHAANVTWSANVRRVAEGFWYFIFIAFVLVVILGLFGLDQVYDWTNPEIHHHFGAIKQAYMSKPGFFVKQIIFFGIAIFFGGKLVGLSLKQDQTGDVELSKSLNKWSVVFLFMFAYSFTVA